jgi:phage tail-like protein
VPDKSSYLRYLPPVLWEKDPPAPAFSLGGMLRVFEKLLTGIPDGEVIAHGDHAHEPVEAVIARLHRLFNPWTTPANFLDWLASWVDLEFIDLWDEYERRKLTTQVVQFYRRRGLKAGLDLFLDLYTVAAKRPRIAVDDCSRILFTRPEPGRFAPVHTLVSQAAVSQTTPARVQGLVAPLCLTRAPDGSLLVGDAGTPGGWAPVLEEGVWQITPAGRYRFGVAPALPQRLGPAAWNLEFPVALATDAASPWNLFVLDRVVAPLGTALYRLTSPGFGAASALATKADLGTLWPVAMALDANGHLLILERGASPANPSAPKVLDVTVGPPLAVNVHPLAQVVEPLSLLVQPTGDLIIGDARDQAAPVPADLVRVDRSGPAWVESLLLAALPAAENPLAAPAAVVREGADHLYVLDLGLKPLMPPPGTPYIRKIAEPAAVYRVSLGGAGPAVARATETRQLVYPTGMVADGGTLYVCDRGEYSDPAFAGPLLRAWRAAAHEFGVVVHFSDQRPTTTQERRKIVYSIQKVINQGKPAHAAWTLVYSV